MLIPRPAALSEGSSGSNWRSYWAAPDAYRLWSLTLQARGPDERLISHNMQVKLGAPDLPREQADAQVALMAEIRVVGDAPPRVRRVAEGRNRHVTSVADQLSAFTAQATGARGDDASTLEVEWEERRFAATGPAGWPGRR